MMMNTEPRTRQGHPRPHILLTRQEAWSEIIEAEEGLSPRIKDHEEAHTTFLSYDYPESPAPVENRTRGRRALRNDAGGKQRSGRTQRGHRAGASSLGQQKSGWPVTRISPSK